MVLEGWLIRVMVMMMIMMVVVVIQRLLPAISQGRGISDVLAYRQIDIDTTFSFYCFCFFFFLFFSMHFYTLDLI